MPESAEEDPAGERVVTVAPERLGRWLTGFSERHGAISVAADSLHVTLGGSDGARAVITVTFPPLPSSSDPINALLDDVSRERRVGALLVRKGGYAVGIFDGRKLIRSKVGSAYVQGKTKAGGWSQQRFARRRQNQTAKAYAAAADVASTVLLPAVDELAAVFLGGDRTAVTAVLADPRLAPVQAKSRPGVLAVAEPRLAVLREFADQFLAISIRLNSLA
jgi:Actinobacteria/chloroflexi VLRF1 release factor